MCFTQTYEYVKKQHRLSEMKYKQKYQINKNVRKLFFVMRKQGREGLMYTEKTRKESTPYH